jgi:hypothetical protein
LGLFCPLVGGAGSRWGHPGLLVRHVVNAGPGGYPPPMRLSSSSLLVVLVALPVLAVAGLGDCNLFDPSAHRIWICLNPVTGKEDGSIHDDNHYVNGVFDPCHCYDPCGPENTCPDVVDAGPLPPGCDAGANDAGW